MSVVFSTPGLIPIEAFTVFGMNAKPNSTNPFGFFGTGLKIAIAVCIRMGQEVVIWRGKDKYTFYVKPTDFRGKEFGKVRMKLETWQLMPLGTMFGFGKARYHDLPFTTELGKTWELWQAFREFHTNTVDEGGRTDVWNETNPWHNMKALLDETFKGEHTHIVVTGQKFADEYHDRHRNFLPDGLTERSESTGAIQVLDRPSKHVYYRGVRVMDLKKEARFTYNFLKHIDLTEDRTAKYSILLEADIADLIMESEDQDFVEKATGSGTASSWEGSMSYAYASRSPSKTFIQVASNSPNATAKAKAVEAGKPIVPTTRIIITVPRSEVTDEELQQLEDAVSRVFGTVQVEKQG